MALRVLLADESPTIKKVFQLSLQDYGVEVKSVNVGVDVIEATKNFKPDIIFADVLLQQLSGYQVSSEIKFNDDYSETPIVLMWSGFMDIDEDKFQASHADAKLEKPFDVDKLRAIIHELVPKVTSQKLSDYLEFPNLPDFDNKAEETEQTTKEKSAEATKPPPIKTKTPPPVKATPAPPTKEAEPVSELNSAEKISSDISRTDNAQEKSSWNMEEFESVDLSQQMETRENEEDLSLNEEVLQEADDDSEWVQGNIESFKLNIEVDANSVSDDVEIPIDSIVSESTVEAATRATLKTPPIPSKTTATTEDMDLEIEKPIEDELSPFDATNIPQLNEDRLMEIIEAQSKEVIEKVVWKVVPEIATQVIERELKRLLEEQNTPLR